MSESGVSESIRLGQFADDDTPVPAVDGDLCPDCFHVAVCTVAQAVKLLECGITISRCGHYLALPESDSGE